MHKAMLILDTKIGKGDHRHVGTQELETTYVFKSLVQLLKGYTQDVERFSGEIK